jgi:hypothetical protein
VVAGVGSFVAADVYHLNTIWILVAWLSVGFFATVGWDYRREFKSAPFGLFFFVWMVIHSLIVLIVFMYLSWL